MRSSRATAAVRLETVLGRARFSTPTLNCTLCGCPLDTNSTNDQLPELIFDTDTALCRRRQAYVSLTTSGERGQPVGCKLLNTEINMVSNVRAEK
jgi:hypothetical protein